MTTFARRRARPVRPKRKQRGSLGTFLAFLAVALLFAGFGVLATYSSKTTSTASPVPVHAKTIHIDGRPSAVVVSSGLVFVADDEKQSVHIVDMSKGRVVGSPIAVGKNPIALATDGRSVYVGHASGDITRISIAKRRITGIAHAGGSITGLTFFDGHLWAADLGRRELLEIARLRVVRRVHDVGPVRVISADGAVWMTTDRDEVARFDPSTGELRRVKVGTTPIGLAAGGGSIWTPSDDLGTVTRVDEKSLRVIGKPITVGNGPVNAAYRDGIVWVSNNNDHTMSRIDVKTGRVMKGAIEVLPDVRGLASDHDLWLVGTDPNEVVRLSE